MKSKRLFAVVTAVSLLLCGCQKIDNTNIPQEIVQTDGSVIPAGEDVLTTTAKSEPITLSNGPDGLYDITPTEDGFFCVIGDEQRKIHLFHFHEDTLSFSETILVQPAPYDGYYYKDGVTAVGDDAFYCFAVMENHSDLPPYDASTDIDNYDWDLYYESWESAYYLCTYTMDGILASSVPVEGLETYKNQYEYDQFCDLFAHDGKVYLLLQDGTVILIGMDGSLTETYKAEEGSRGNGAISASILLDRDGKPVYYALDSYVTPDGFYSESVSLSDFNVQTGKPDEPFYTMETNNEDASIAPGGYGEYRLFINQGKTLCGIRDDSETEVVIDWYASDLPAMECIPLKDGTFLSQNPWNDDNTIYHVSRKYASEIKEKQVIQLGILGESYLFDDFVMDFNRAHDDYRIETISYRNSDGTTVDDPEATKKDALDQLKLAVISDDAPDLLLLFDHHDTLLKLGSRGVFLDLYEMMEDDTDVNRDTLLPNVCKALEHPNGALYGLTPNFSVRSIAVKSQFYTQENWTIQDMIDLYEGADEVMYQWQTKEDTLQMLLTGTDFTDEINGTCNFDSPEFIQMLEFCNRYPAQTNQPEKDYEDPDAMAKLNKWYTDSYLRYQHDEDYLFFTSFSAISKGNMASAWAYTKADLGGDFTLVGFPSDNGQGGKIAATEEMAILGTCKDKAAAWEVLKAYLNSEALNNSEYFGYSIFETQFEEQLDDEMYIMEFGERTDLEYYDDDSNVYPLTQEERNNLEVYIRNCETFMMLDENVKNIVLEEAGMYFNGDRSAEDTAKAIQSRTEILLSEQS